ncbi:hypothetical protein SCOCK_120142 [Actinacidiphila cocklensis]|uniref:Uncharacterized protein n=1 Tax=Actinacidiphila cocklensis TaxID=887465 RepID=A0A9W4DQ60_9ACTN|nr:hypothetical protein SCOCK_120142 [Actinacidiphila cocklensis]
MGRHRRLPQGQPAGGHLPGRRGLHPPPAAPRLGQVRHRRGVRRPRHRHRDAHGPAPAELRHQEARPRHQAHPRGVPGDRTDGHPRLPAHPRHGRRVDGQVRRRLLVLALGAHHRADRGRPAGAHRPGRRPRQARRIRHHDRPRPGSVTIMRRGHNQWIRLSGGRVVD